MGNVKVRFIVPQTNPKLEGIIFQLNGVYGDVRLVTQAEYSLDEVRDSVVFLDDSV